MTFYERYDALCQEKGFSGQSKQAFEQIGLGKGTVGGWKKNGNIPAAEYLIIVSQFFEVSIDYLVGLTDVRERGIDLSKEEHDLLNRFRNLDDDGKYVVMGHVIEEERSIEKKKKHSPEQSVG